MNTSMKAVSLLFGKVPEKKILNEQEKKISDKMKDLSESNKLKVSDSSLITSNKRDFMALLQNSDLGIKDKKKYVAIFKEENLRSTVLYVHLLLEHGTEEQKNKALEYYNTKLRDSLINAGIKKTELPAPYPPSKVVGSREGAVNSDKVSEVMPKEYYKIPLKRAVLNNIKLSKYENDVNNLVNELKIEDGQKLRFKRAIYYTLLELENIDSEGNLSKKYLDSLKDLRLSEVLLAKYYGRISFYTEKVYEPKNNNILFKANVYKKLYGLMDSVISTKTDASTYSEQLASRAGTEYEQAVVGTLRYPESQLVPGQVTRQPFHSGQDIVRKERSDFVTLQTYRSMFEVVRRSDLSINPSNVNARDDIRYEIMEVLTPSPNVRISSNVESARAYYASKYPLREPKPNLSGFDISLRDRVDGMRIDHAPIGIQKYKLPPMGSLEGTLAGWFDTINLYNEEKFDKTKVSGYLFSGNVHYIGDAAKERLKLLLNRQKEIPPEIKLGDDLYIPLKQDGKIIFSDGIAQYGLKIPRNNDYKIKNLVELLEKGATNIDESRITIKDILEDPDYFDEATSGGSSASGRGTNLDTDSKSSDWTHTFNTEFLEVGRLNVETAQYGFTISDFGDERESDYYAKFLSHWAGDPRYANDQFLVIKGYETPDGHVMTAKTFIKDKDRIYEIRGGVNDFIKQFTHTVVEGHELGIMHTQYNIQPEDLTMGGFFSIQLPENSALMFHVQSIKPFLPTAKTDEGTERTSDTSYQGTVKAIIKKNHNLEAIVNLLKPVSDIGISGSGGIRYRFENSKRYVEITAIGGEHTTEITINDEVKETKGTDIVGKLIWKEKIDKNTLKFHVGYERGVYDYENYLNTADAQKAYYDALNRVFVGSGYERRTDSGAKIGGEFLFGFPWKDKEEFDAAQMTAKVLIYINLLEKSGFRLSAERGDALTDMLNEKNKIISDLQNDKMDKAISDRRIKEFFDKYNDVAKKIWNGTLDIMIEDTLYVTSNISMLEGEKLPERGDFSLLWRIGQDGFVIASADTEQKFPYPSRTSTYADSSNVINFGVGGGVTDAFRLDYWTTHYFKYTINDKKELELEQPKILHTGSITAGSLDGPFIGHLQFTGAKDFYEGKTDKEKPSDYYRVETGFLAQTDRVDFTAAFGLSLRDSDPQNINAMFGIDWRVTSIHTLTSGLIFHRYIVNHSGDLRGENSFNAYIGWKRKDYHTLSAVKLVGGSGLYYYQEPYMNITQPVSKEGPPGYVGLELELKF